MQLIQEKQSFALRILYDRYVRLVYSFAMKSAGDTQYAQDIVQLVFTRLWTTEHGYDPAKGKFVSWLLTITRNIAIDQLRKQRNQQATIAYEEQTLAAARLSSAGSDDLDHEITRRLLKEEIEQAYRFLSSSQIQLIRRLYWEGYTLNEIAVQNGEPLGTVKSRLHQALKTLRKHLNTIERSELP